MLRRKRVLVHLKDDGLPSIEGVLLRRGFRSYHVAEASLLVHKDATPAVLNSRVLVVPLSNIAFYEIL